MGVSLSESEKLLEKSCEIAKDLHMQKEYVLFRTNLNAQRIGLKDTESTFYIKPFLWHATLTDSLFRQLDDHLQSSSFETKKVLLAANKDSLKR